jgi:hypothetical protein
MLAQVDARLRFIKLCTCTCPIRAVQISGLVASLGLILLEKRVLSPGIGKSGWGRCLIGDSLLRDPCREGFERAAHVVAASSAK